MFELVIKNAKIADPLSSCLRIGNIGIKSGKIAAISTEHLQGTMIYDATGHILSPGFIDVHAHVDGQEHCGQLSLLQGITTSIGGNCGFSAEDLGAWMTLQEEQGFCINQAQQCGHSACLRQSVGLSSYQTASPEQIRKMVYSAEQLMELGAVGISFGLDYSPAISTKEFHAIGAVAAKYGRFVSVDTRMKHNLDFHSLDEVEELARVTEAKILVSHFVYQYGYDIMDKALDLVDGYRARGLDVWIDSGMYKDWSSFIGAALFDEEHMNLNDWTFDFMIVCTGIYKGEWMTREIYDDLRRNHPKDSVIVLTGNVNSIYQALMKDYAMISSDAGEYRKGEGHPQAAGSFPRFFQQMVRERKDLGLIEAVKKATFLPAQTVGLKNKGRIEIGSDADLVVFDLNKITDKADFPGYGIPDQEPVGIDLVIVNGQIAAKDGKATGERAGKLIRFSN